MKSRFLSTTALTALLLVASPDHVEAMPAAAPILVGAMLSGGQRRRVQRRRSPWLRDLRRLLCQPL